MLTERRHYKGIMLFHIVEVVEVVEVKWNHSGLWPDCLANI